MGVSRRTLGALFCALIATAAMTSAAAASHTGTPGVSKKQIVIGGTFPFTGPASLYKTIPAAEEAYYAYVNAHGGVNHRKIKDIALDDAYDPSQTVPQTKKLVEQDHVFAVVGSLGTAPILSTWKYLNQRKIPQVLVATGDAYWGQCVHKACPAAGATTPRPWTMGWQPDYPGEAKVYAKYIVANKPGAKIGVLYQNDAYGKNYLNGLKTGLGSHKNQIVDAESYNVTDSAQVIGAHVLALRAKGADTFVIFATPQPTIEALVARTTIGWNPLTLVNNVSADRVFELLAAQNGASLNGIISSTYIESPTVNAGLKGMKLAKQIIQATGNTSLEQSFAEGDSNIVYGLASAWTFVDALKHAGKNPTRPSLMHALRNLNEKNPFVYPGMSVKTSKNRPFPMEQLKLIKWSGGSGGDWSPFGKLYSGIR
jgi:branched-chain amino acid transport system substrate-binding protein